MEGREVSFSSLKMLDDEISEEEVLEKIMKEQGLHTGSKARISQNQSKNLFDWDKDEEATEYQSMQMVGSNLMGVDARDFEVAHEFLKKSRTFSKNEKDFDESPQDFLGEKQNNLEVGKQFAASNQRTTVSARKKQEFSKPKLFTPEIKEKLPVKSNAADSADLTDIVSEKPQISSREHNALKQKIRELRHTVEELKNEKWKALPPSEILQRIILGKPYSLDHYKSLKEKLELLDHAVKINDGNAITVVVLFLEKTLKSEIFTTQLKRRKKALNHYLRYLEVNGEWKILMDLLLQMNRNEDAIVLNYRYVSRIKNPTTKLHELDKLLSKFRNKQDLGEIFSYIEEERTLLEQQIKIEKEDEQSEKQGKNLVMRIHPRSSSVLLTPLLTTLYYCTLYHFQKTSDEFHPSVIKLNFKLTEKQYEWTVIPACAKLHRWTDISEILTSTSWLRKKTEKSFIGFDQICRILQTSGAPGEILEKYARLIDNADTRLKIATLCKCHDVAIDAILHLKDKQKLEQYRQHVVYDERLRRKITNLLSDQNIKWR